MKVGEALPNIFRRTAAVLEPGTQILVAASLLRFHQIDALPIRFEPSQKKKFAVFGFSCLSKLLETPAAEYQEFLELPCENASLELSTVDVDDSLEDLLRVFERTRFGFAWVDSDKLGGFASLRDVLELYGNDSIVTNMAVEQVASPIFSMEASSPLSNVINEMFNHKFRRIFVKGQNSVVTDRRIIGYLFSASRLTETAKNPETLLDGKLGDLEKVEPIHLAKHSSIKEAALSMVGAVEECLTCDSGVVTPWDLVMKPLKGGNLVIK